MLLSQQFIHTMGALIRVDPFSEGFGKQEGKQEVTEIIIIRSSGKISRSIQPLNVCF